jgi:hypothetical protein
MLKQQACTAVDVGEMQQEILVRWKKNYFLTLLVVQLQLSVGLDFLTLVLGMTLFPFPA